MPRPLKPSRELRQRFDLYLDENETEQLRANAQAARLPMSTFLRRVALRQRVEVPPSAGNVERWRELAPLASNLNQLARCCNAGLVPQDLAATLAALDRQVGLLRAELLGVGDPRRGQP